MEVIAIGRWCHVYTVRVWDVAVASPLACVDASMNSFWLLFFSFLFALVQAFSAHFEIKISPDSIIWPSQDNSLEINTTKSVNFWNFKSLLTQSSYSVYRGWTRYVVSAPRGRYQNHTIIKYLLCVRSFDCVWFSHFQFVADFHTENSTLSRTCGRRIEKKNRGEQ